MYRIVLPLAVLAMTAAVPASAQETSQPTEKPAKEKKICKTETGTGSIMPKRTCRTKGEWDSLTEQSKNNLQRTQSRDAGMGMISQ